MTARCAVYAGSFDPFTRGHMNILLRAATMFDEVILAIGHNPNKATKFLTVEDRLYSINAALIDEGCNTAHLGNIVALSYDGLLAEFVKRMGSNILIRGLRPLGDFDYEYNMAMVNRSIFTGSQPLETVFILAEPHVAHMSSGMVREVYSFSGDISEMVPAAVKKIIDLRFKEKKA